MEHGAAGKPARWRVLLPMPSAFTNDRQIVWEWAQDTWHDTTRAPRRRSSLERPAVAWGRGGSWSGSANDRRAAYRHWFTPSSATTIWVFGVLRAPMCESLLTLNRCSPPRPQTQATPVSAGIPRLVCGPARTSSGKGAHPVGRLVPRGKPDIR